MKIKYYEGCWGYMKNIKIFMSYGLWEFKKILFFNTHHCFWAMNFYLH